VALAERFRAPIGSKPDGVTCELFEAPAGTKRCSHYVGRGACGLEGEFMCVEWLRVNGHPSHKSLPLVRESEPTPAPVEPLRAEAVERDLFGNVIKRPPPLREAQAGRGSAPPRMPPSAPADERAPPPPVVRTLTDADVAAFEKLGVEVCLETASCGALWLVPAYTHAPERNEISIRDAATLAALCAAFPGAQILGFTPAKKSAAT
jgi:hypothetical protein